MRVLDLDIEVHREVYEPAEDTLLVAKHLDAGPGERCLDIGTGSGALAMVMARDGAKVVATDVSPIACRQARENAGRNGLTIDAVTTDLAAGITGPFDLIACNPPYLPTAEGQTVKGPLNRAFDGGADGADVTRAVLSALPGLLARAEDGGRAFLLATQMQPLVRLKGYAHILGLTWEVVEHGAEDGEGRLCVKLERVGDPVGPPV